MSDNPPDKFSTSIDELTQAFGDQTRRAIYLHVRDLLEGVTAAEIADLFAIHANVARHHLEKLVEGNFLTVCTPASATANRGAGRPSKRYVVSSKEVAVSLPFRDDQLLIDLLLTTLTNLEPGQASQLAEAAGRTYGARYADAAAAGTQLSIRDALSAVAAVMREKGFAAAADPVENEIVAHSCPFGDLAKQFPHVVCALDRGMVEGMLERLSGLSTEAHLVASRAQGDEECITVL